VNVLVPRTTRYMFSNGSKRRRVRIEGGESQGGSVPRCIEVTLLPSPIQMLTASGCSPAVALIHEYRDGG
jgi:hypothetical protein